MRPDIDISYTLHGRVRDYAELHELETAEAYQRVIESGIDRLEEAEEEEKNGDTE